jgi:hypothetical protein
MIGDGLQRALFDALKTAGIAGGRIYDQVPPNAKFPYVTIGDEQVIDDGNTCTESWEVYPDVHVWSRPDAGSKGELKIAMKAAADAILAIASVPGLTLVSVKPETSRSFREPDGKTEHGVLTFRFIIDPA